MSIHDQQRYYQSLTREIGLANVSALDGVAAQIWRAHLAGKISDTQGQLLAEQVSRRRAVPTPDEPAAPARPVTLAHVPISAELSALVREQMRGYATVRLHNRR